MNYEILMCVEIGQPWHKRFELYPLRTNIVKTDRTKVEIEVGEFSFIPHWKHLFSSDRRKLSNIGRGLYLDGWPPGKIILVARIAQKGIATRYWLDDPVIESRCGGREEQTFFRTRPDQPWGVHPASYTMGTGSFLGVKWPGRGSYHSSQSSTEVEGRVELYFCSTSGHLWFVIGWPLPLCDQKSALKQLWPYMAASKK